MNKRLIILLGALLTTAVVYLGIGWYFSNQIIVRPITTLATAAERGPVPSDYDLPTPEAFSVANGAIELQGWYFPNEIEGECAVVLLHGSTSNRYGVLHYTPLFWNRGCDLIMYDARGHGDSTLAFHTYGYYEKEDLVRVVEWTTERTGLPLSQVGLAGVSYGAATALQAAPLLPEVAFVLADSSYEDLQGIISYQAVAQYGNWINLFVPGALWVADWRSGMSHTAVSPTIAASQATDTPMFIIHSLQDEFTPSTHSETIYAQSNPRTTLLHVVDWGAGHGRALTTRPNEYARLFEDFMVAYAPDFGYTAVGP